MNIVRFFFGLEINFIHMTLQIVECNALPTLILMLRSEDAAIHYEAVGLFVTAFILCVRGLVLLGIRCLPFFLLAELADFSWISGWCDWKSGTFITKYKERSSPCRSSTTCHWIA